MKFTAVKDRREEGPEPTRAASQSLFCEAEDKQQQSECFGPSAVQRQVKDE